MIPHISNILIQKGILHNLISPITIGIYNTDQQLTLLIYQNEPNIIIHNFQTHQTTKIPPANPTLTTTIIQKAQTARKLPHYKYTPRAAEPGPHDQQIGNILLLGLLHFKTPTIMVP